MRHHPYRLYGLVALAVVGGLVAVCILQFNQVFRTSTYVSVRISKAGLQLLPGSDVKVRGIVVGDVADIGSDGTVATLRLRLDPARAAALPANVSVRLLPKTLFGEKYVDLVLPRTPTPQHLHQGQVIAEDRSTPALEIDQALDDLLPVLRTVPPAQLNQTLTAIATALSGRGEQLGRTIVDLGAYLRQLDPHVPTLTRDLGAFAQVARTYSTASGPLLRMLRNLTVTSTTVVDEKKQLDSFLTDVTTAADTTSDLLVRNATDLIDVNRANRPVIALLERYSPEFPCFFKGYDRLIPRIHDAVSTRHGINHSAHVVVEFVPSYPTYHRPQDLPEFQDTRGPHCYGLPNPPMSLPNIRFKDGTQDDPAFRRPGPRSTGNVADLLWSPLHWTAGSGR